MKRRDPIRMILVVAGCAVLGAGALAIGVVLVSDTFDDLELGPLPQGAWSVISGSGQIQDATTVAGSAQALQVDTTSEVDRPVADAAGHDVLWVDGWVNAPGEPEFPDLDEMQASGAVASSLICFHSQEGIQALNGNGSGGGTWVATGVSASGFVRVTIRQDYTSKTWDLYLNEDAFVRKGLGFKDNSVALLSGLRIETGPNAATVLDDLTIGTDAPDFVPTPTPTPEPAHIVAGLQGDPCVDEAFSVPVSISNNNSGPLGTYSFVLNFNTAQLTFVDALDGSFGVKPDKNSPSPGEVRISAFNAGSTLANGTIFVLQFTVNNPGDPGTLSIALADFGPTPLIGTNFLPIVHDFDLAAVTNICEGPTPTSPPATDTPTQAPPTATPTDTPTAPVPTDTPTGEVPTATPTDTQPITGAVIAGAVTTGDPCVDNAFTVSVTISDNDQGIVGTYAFRLTYDPAVVTFGSVEDGAFGVKPDTAGVEGAKNISAFNAGSTLENGVLFTMTMNVTSPGATAPITLTLSDFGPTPLIGINFLPIDHGFDNSGTTNLCGAVVTETPVVATETPVVEVTDTPTMPVPTDTPTVPVPTDTPTVEVPTATPTDTQPITGAVIASAVTAGDPCADGTFTVSVTIANNDQGIVGTYAFRLTYDPAVVTFNDVAAGEFGVKPDTAGAEGAKNISAFNAGSTVENGVLFTVTMNVTNPGATAPITLTLSDFGPTPLIGINFQSIDHGFDNSGTTGLCGAVVTETPVEATETPIVATETPVVPTETPVEATATPTVVEISPRTQIMFYFSRDWQDASQDVDYDENGKVEANDLLIYAKTLD